MSRHNRCDDIIRLIDEALAGDERPAGTGDRHAQRVARPVNDSRRS